MTSATPEVNESFQLFEQLDDLPNGNKKLVADSPPTRVTEGSLNNEGAMLLVGGSGEVSDDVKKDHTPVEICNPEGKKLEENLGIALEITPVNREGEENSGYDVVNKSNNEIIIWVYGHDEHIAPGEKFPVSGNVPKDENGKDLQGAEAGSFYISIKDQAAVKVSRNSNFLSNDINIKNFSLSKKNSKVEKPVDADTPPNETVDIAKQQIQENERLSWEDKEVTDGEEGKKNFPIKAVGTGSKEDRDQEVPVGKIEVQNDLAFLKLDRGIIYSLHNEADDKHLNDVDDKVADGEESVYLTPGTYFIIRNKVYYFQGVQKDGQPRIVDIKG